MLLDQIHTQLPQRPAPVRQIDRLWRLLCQLYYLGYLVGRNSAGRTTLLQLPDRFHTQLLESMQILIHGVGVDPLRHRNLQRVQSHAIQDQSLCPPSLMWINSLNSVFTQPLYFSSQRTANFHRSCHDNTSLPEACHSNSDLWTDSHIN